MSPNPQDDDPTHALDDFVRRMRPGAAPPPAAPDLSGLQDRLHPGQPAGSAKARGGKLRSGQTWHADDVVDVPDVALPRMPPVPTHPPDVTLPQVDLANEAALAAQPPEIALPAVAAPAPPDGHALDDATRQASDQVHSQWGALDQANAEPAWQPSLQSLHLRRHADPRLLATWQAGAWTGAVRQVMQPTTEFVTTPTGTAVESYPPHRLLLLWPPQRIDQPHPGRWPQQVLLTALPAGPAADALLALVPGGAALWINPAVQEVDWALAAEIVLLHQPGLRPFQTNGLRAFIESEREASFARLNDGYQPPGVQDGGAVQRRTA